MTKKLNVTIKKHDKLKRKIVKNCDSFKNILNFINSVDSLTLQKNLTEEKIKNF